MIIGLENQFLLFLRVAVFTQVLLHLYVKCSKNFEHFSLSVLKENVGYKGWNSQNACHNSKRGKLSVYALFVLALLAGIKWSKF